MTFSLIACDQNGVPVQPLLGMQEALITNCQATADLYRQVGFVQPWIGYVAIMNNKAIGGGAFVGPPKEGYVEIAYFTLEGEEGKRYASQTAASLVAIAQKHDPKIGIKAFTLMEENPSTKILRGLGFSIVGVAIDADAGEVWEWHKPASNNNFAEDI